MHSSKKNTLVICVQSSHTTRTQSMASKRKLHTSREHSNYYVTIPEQSKNIPRELNIDHLIARGHIAARLDILPTLRQSSMNKLLCTQQFSRNVSHVRESFSTLWSNVSATEHLKEHCALKKTFSSTAYYLC